MRGGSPVLSAGRRRRSSGAPSRSLRSLRRSLLQDMNLCYRLLRQLVPGLPPGRAASRVEILQHVIDYILDLQTELDASCPAADRGELLHRDRQQSDQGSGTAHSFQEEEERQSCSAGLSRSTLTVRRL